MTMILKTDPQRPDPEVLRTAAEILRGGGIVAFPTETVYGLAAVVFNEAAVKKIFFAKMRPPDNPLIVHISDISMLDEVAVNVPKKAYNLMETFWPGPLTLILPKHHNVPKTVTGGLDTVAVRMPAHPVAMMLINEVGVPIAAPSANLAGRPSPTTAAHVIRDLYGRIDAIIDAGETIYGVESTVVNILAEPPLLLRPGAYTVEDLERVLGEKITIPEFARGYIEAEDALAPGMKYKHYSPETPIILIDPSSGDVKKMVDVVRDTALSYINEGYRVCIVATFENVDEYSSISRNAVVLGLGSRKNAFEIAKNLFKILRSIDDLNCDIAIIEGVQEKGLGLTVMNRLRKASKTIIKA
ncbi:MAG: L-threonylcarbamoyladenylate synthase [Aigarchaeota archaeon]|nr:L-threonylcarbamoyladenylate synthase [Aigarchaeota archaeon]MDW8021253.1 L-threonylcarbamoyladenylate synthase [Nitrososphaerota archaeon]